MTYFHGEDITHTYFEGWYLKHQKGSKTIALIPAFHIDNKGKRTASIQIVTNDNSHSIYFKKGRFKVNPNLFCVKVGDNVFSEKGISVNIKTKGIAVKGKLKYSSLTLLESDIMGPFQYIPFMQCNHGVLSLTHRLKGTLIINGESYDFTGGTGYIETDWGRSFPDSYVWTQCNWNDKNDNSIMVSIAEIPFLGCKF